ncbi:MAG TPA: lytic transglycosylase domain-containing protein [Rickettsiales bacterium]|nr:lytic transglycosylase domain-containing protein [Rickettsiales bacterium]
MIRYFIFFFIFFNTLVLAEISDNENNFKNLFFKTNQDIKIKLELDDADIKTFNKTEKFLNKKNWAEALSWADSIKSENLKDAVIDYVLWKKYTNMTLSNADTDFSDLLLFIQTHTYLPNIVDLKIKAESIYLTKDVPYQFVEKYFEQIKPFKTNTAIKVLQDKYITNDKNVDEKLQKEIVDTFYKYDFTDEEMNKFLDLFSEFILEENYAEKIESLLWDKDYLKANFLMNNLGVIRRTLYSAIIEINKNPKYINNILRSIPNDFRENELLLYTRFVYLYKNKDKDEALKILLNLTKNTKYPEKWWLYQKYFSRELLNDKDYKKAYYLAVNNNLKYGGSDYAEAQWFAGWIALIYLNKPKDAYYHFYDMYNAVNYPVSKSRGAYWAGRAMEADNNKEEAIKWYNIGSQYPLYFYGQLSFHAKNELLDMPSLINTNPLPVEPSFTEKDEEKVLNNDIVKIAYLIAKSNGNEKDYTDLFISAINRVSTKEEMAVIFEVVKNTGNENLITKIAKNLTNKDVYYVDNLFPILNIINLQNPNSNLVHSLIKQESGFHVSAESCVGATGFMQLMPDTAKQVAKQMNLKYNYKSLKTNPVYNILLGSYYINSLIKQFQGSQILAIASYNAGPTPVNRWIKQYGDPREMTDIKDVVNWMESIGYSETRNYVQRIIEGSIVYEYILDKVNNNNIAQQ